MGTKLSGSKIFLQTTISDIDYFVVCEQTSSLSITVENEEIRCKTTGEWAEQLEGGNKSGTFSYTGLFVKDPEINEASFEELYEQLGNILPWKWGGIEPGDFLFEANAKITEFTVNANQGESVSFDMTLTISEQPTLTTVGT